MKYGTTGSTTTSTDAYDSYSSTVRCSPPKERRRIVFVGNPGVGKSYLLNLLTGNDGNFASGASLIGGMTRRAQSVIHDDIEWVDTPGLADVEYGHNAAEQITHALSPSPSSPSSSSSSRLTIKTSVIFVVTLSSSGGIRGEDAQTIMSVSQAAGDIVDPFVIVNKVEHQPDDNDQVINNKYVSMKMMISNIHTRNIFCYKSNDNRVDDLKRFVLQAPYFQQDEVVAVVYKDRALEVRRARELAASVSELRARVEDARRRRARAGIVFTVVGVGILVGTVQLVHGWRSE